MQKTLNVNVWQRATDPKHAEEYEWCELNEIPRVVVLYVEHHEVVVAKRVERT